MLIDRFQLNLIGCKRFIIQVDFIKNNAGRDVISGCSYKEPVDEAGRGFGACKGNDQESMIQVGSNDMGDLG